MHLFLRRTPHAVPGGWCLEHLSQAPPGNTPQHLALLPCAASFQWRLDSSLRGLIPAVPRCPGVSNLLEASSVFTFLLPVPVVHFFGGPGPTHPPAALLHHSHHTRGKRQAASTVLTAPWRAGGKALNPGWRGWLLIYFFLLRFPPLSQFSFPACGISRSRPPIPDLCPQQGRAGSKRRWDLVLCNRFLLIIWITARNQNKD